VTGEDVVREARSFIGCRYRHQGRSRSGVDCIGLPVCVRAGLGLQPLDAAPGYARTSEAFEMLHFCRVHMSEVDCGELQPGDVLVQVNGMNRHMAIVADYLHGGLSIVHAWLPNKKVVECRLDDDFMAIVAGCFRFKEIDE
jgi:cell wall-associated NlpC family hydrolase